MVTTVAFAVVFAVLTGLVLRKLAIYDKEDLFDDRTYWEVSDTIEEDSLLHPPTASTAL